jgi:hypothetical protein
MDDTAAIGGAADIGGLPADEAEQSNQTHCGSRVGENAAMRNTAFSIIW